MPRPYDLMPAGITAGILSKGVGGNRQMTVFQRLTHEDEQRWDGTISECAVITSEFSDLSLMVFHKPDTD